LAQVEHHNLLYSSNVSAKLILKAKGYQELILLQQKAVTQWRHKTTKAPPPSGEIIVVPPTNFESKEDKLEKQVSIEEWKRKKKILEQEENDRSEF
jgi:hypothetical protein